MDHPQIQDAPTSAPSPAVSVRGMLILLFVIALLATSGIANGQVPEPLPIGSAIVDLAPVSTTIQYDGVSHVVPVAHHSEENRLAIAGRNHAAIAIQSARPKYVEMVASLANFDADADPDGWRVELVLLDQRDRPVIVRANATFELMPRVPTADFFSYVDAATLPVRWSMNLDFDEDAVARVKLPLRESFRPLFGWPSAIIPRQDDRTRLSNSIHRQFSGNGRSRSIANEDWRNQLGRPMMGELKVRVSVPTEGVFQAAAFVPIRPPALVDTPWPYR